MSILIIDSDPGSEVRLKGFLGGHGFRNIVIEKTARSAREYLKNNHALSDKNEIKFIIINSELDDEDGYALCREIHTNQTGRNAYKIVLVSSVKNNQAIVKARQSGANDFSVKPYESTEFLKHLMMYSIRKMVLLIEDDPVISQIVSKVLSKKQFEIVLEKDGLEAYNMINTMNPPRLVLLDIGLPGMNGIKLLKHIRAKPAWKKTAVLMLTGSTEAGDVKGSLDAGANDYIVKPFIVNNLISRLDKYLESN